MEDLAQLIDSDARRIWLWESEKASPSNEMLIKLAQMLNTTSDYLLGLSNVDIPAGVPRKDLTDKEWAVIKALRRDDRLEAVRVIVSGS